MIEWTYELQKKKKERFEMVMGRPRKITPIEEIEVYQMHRKKRPLAEIAYTFGISVSTVRRIVNKVKEQKGESQNEG